MTYSVSGPMSPECSAIGMNSSGMTRPRRGWCQRISASTPTTSPPATATLGWKWTWSSLVLQAVAQPTEQGQSTRGVLVRSAT